MNAVPPKTLETEARCFNINPEISNLEVAQKLKLSYWDSPHCEPACCFFVDRGNGDYDIVAIRTESDELAVFINRFEELRGQAFSMDALVG